MKLADELFSHYIPKKDALLAYGFSEADGLLYYKTSILEGALELVFRLRDHVLQVSLLDPDFGDEYRRIDAEEEVGGFVADARKECEEVLLDLRARCFEKRNFISDQSNRLSSFIEKKYGVLPEFLWEDSPDCGVFRNGRTNKWFGILMNIRKTKLIPGEPGMVEVVNLKLDDLVESSLTKKGIYPAYHMTKKNWVSVILDDTLEDQALYELVNISFAHSDEKKKKA